MQSFVERMVNCYGWKMAEDRWEIAVHAFLQTPLVQNDLGKAEAAAAAYHTSIFYRQRC